MAKDNTLVEIRFTILKHVKEQLLKEAEERGCVQLSEYLRLLIYNNPYRISAEELGCDRITDVHRAFFTLLRLSEELSEPGSFLSRVLKDSEQGVPGILSHVGSKKAG